MGAGGIFLEKTPFFHFLNYNKFAGFLLARYVLHLLIRSEGGEDPGRYPSRGTASIKVNGKDYSPRLRGHNVVILSGVTGNICRTHCLGRVEC